MPGWKHGGKASPVFVATLVALWLGVTGCSPDPGAELSGYAAEDTRRALDRARSATEDLARRLAAELGEQLASGVPAAAINVCSEVAPEVTSELTRDGLEIRRTSLRTRNPGNAADAWERGWLERFEELVAGGELPADVHEIDQARGELRYLRPILVGAPCLLCHGAEDQLDPAVLRRLAERYPEDRATGYSAGDLRGAFSVRVGLDRDHGSSTATSSTS